MRSTMIAVIAVFFIVAVSAQSIPHNPSEFLITFQPNKIFENGFKQFNEMRINQELCDIELQFESSTILAHSIVLAATIPYFRSILITDTVDTDRNISAALQHLEPSAVENLVQFAYTGSLEINEGNVNAFLVAAEFFQIEMDSQVTASTRITKENVFTLHRLAKSDYFADLLNNTQQFINECFQDAALSDGFLVLNQSELIDIISANDMQVSSEQIIYEAVINWVKYDAANRLALLPQVLRHVRLPFINTQFLRSELTNELYENSIESRELIYQSILYRLVPFLKHTVPDSWTRRSRTPTVIIHVLDVLTRSTFNIDPNEKSIRNVTENNASDFYSIATHGGLVYVFGGGNGAAVAKVESYNKTTDIWTSHLSMNVARYMSSATTLNNTIYVSGGYGIQTNRLTSVECYNALKRTWLIVAPMLVARSSHQMVTLNNHIYAIGGSKVSSVETFDPNTNVWTLATSMNEPRAGFGAVVFNGQIYVCGGSNGTTSTHTAEVFNSIQKTWTYIASMHRPRYRLGLVVFNGRLWAIGGLNNQDDTYFIEEYEPELDSWKAVTFQKSYKQYDYINAVIL